MCIRDRSEPAREPERERPRKSEREPECEREPEREPEKPGYGPGSRAEPLRGSARDQPALIGASRRSEHLNLQPTTYNLQPTTYTGGVAGNNYVRRSRTRAPRASGTLDTVREAMARPPAQYDAYQLRYIYTATT